MGTTRPPTDKQGKVGHRDILQELKHANRAINN